MKIRLKTFITSLFCLLGATLFAQLSAADILKKTGDVLNRNNSVSYKADYKFKFFSNDDTLQFNATCSIAKNYDDSIMKASIAVDFIDGYRKTIYDGKKIYQFNRHPANMFVLVTNPYTEKTNPLKGVIDYGVIDKTFIDPGILLKLLSPDKILTNEGTALIGNTACFKIKVKIPDNEEFKNQYKLYYISTESFYPLKIVHRVEDKDNFQYSEINFDHLKFNSVNKDDFFTEPLIAGLRIITTEELRRQPQRQSLAVNTQAPEFEGYQFSANKKFSSEETKGRLVLLDFWYMACGPCVAAMPALDSLYRKYNESGLTVLGINSVDNTEKQKAKMPKFLVNNPVQYPIVLVDKSIDELFHIDTYPTLYLIDKNGKIIYSHKGLLKSLPKELSDLIEDQLTDH